MKNLFKGCYRDQSVLVTGHTGFKGSWLCLWLQQLGARVSGLSLAPETQPNHHALLQLDMPSVIGDIRDRDLVERVIKDTQPKVVFHLAAQPLVRRSYHDPIGTYATNVLGTAHVLEACRKAESVQAVVAVTTDKCYENREWIWSYRRTIVWEVMTPTVHPRPALSWSLHPIGSLFLQCNLRSNGLPSCWPVLGREM